MAHYGRGFTVDNFKANSIGNVANENESIATSLHTVSVAQSEDSRVATVTKVGRHNDFQVAVGAKLTDADKF